MEQNSELSDLKQLFGDFVLSAIAAGRDATSQIARIYDVHRRLPLMAHREVAKL